MSSLLCFNLHLDFFRNCSSLRYQKLKRKRQNSTSRYKEAILCKVVFKPNVHLSSKLVSISCTMQETPLKSPQAPHWEEEPELILTKRTLLLFPYSLFSYVFPFPMLPAQHHNLRQDQCSLNHTNKRTVCKQGDSLDWAGWRTCPLSPFQC